MKPLTEKASSTLFYPEVVIENGEPVQKLVSKFPLEWVQSHFNHPNDHYIIKPDALGGDDKVVFEKLCKFVHSFIPAECVDKAGKFLLSENGERILCSRLINTKALLECESVEEAMRFLGNELVHILFDYLPFSMLICSFSFADAMPNFRERMVKLAAQGKGKKVPKSRVE